jgi:transcription-repair coupling factor (superfamily II helicase)
MASKATNNMWEGSLTPLLEHLDADKGFDRVVAEASQKTAPQYLKIGAVEGIRPALAAALGPRRHVVVVTASARDSEEVVNEIRSWWAGPSTQIASLDSWETLPTACPSAGRRSGLRRYSRPRHASALAHSAHCQGSW